jgi:NADH-quinone oxidoreductase subunit N
MLKQTLWLLSPELILFLAALLTLGLDIIRPHRPEKRLVPYIALGGVIGALIASGTLWRCNLVVCHVLACDAFAIVIKMSALVTAGIVILISESIVRSHCRHQGVFYALLLFSTLAIVLLAGAINLIMLFLAFALLDITAYLLAGYLHDEHGSTEAAIKYLLYGATLAAVMLYGMSWLYGLTGSTDLEGIAATLGQSENTLRPAVLPALILVTAGLAFKTSAVPFHQWAPDVYEGVSTPVAAFLSVGPTIGGLAVILRVLLTMLPTVPGNLALDWRTLLMAISALTMTIGNLGALGQKSVKRLLAYSSIAQIGYPLIGAVTASPQGATAALLYLIAYVLSNLGVFATVSIITNQTGSDAIHDYAGLHEQAPATALVLTICLLSLGGVPPTAGFIAKLFLFSAAIEKGLLWLAVIGVVNSVISLACYWKVIRALYLSPTLAQANEPMTPPLTLAIASGVAVTGVLGMAILTNLLLELLRIGAQTLFG